MKSFPIFSPTMGLVTDQPSITIPAAATSEVVDMFFKGGEARRYRKRSKLFADSLPDAIVDQYTLNQASASRKYNLYFTARDIAYRDVARDCFVFITPKITEGLITSATEVSNGRVQIELSMDSGFQVSDIQVGDFLRFGDASAIMLSTDDWYEVESLDGGNVLTVLGSLPSGYAVPSLGDEFCVRACFGGDESGWFFDTFAGEAGIETLIATNGVDFPIRWTGGNALCENITDLFKCRWIGAYGGRIIAMNITAGGSSFPVNYRWSELLDETIWEGTLATSGETSLIDGIGEIMRGFIFRDYLYVVRSGSFDRIAVSSDLSGDPFTSRVLRNDLGTLALHSFVFTRDQVYFFCTTDMTFRRFDGFYDTIISKSQDPTVKDITNASAERIKGFFVADTRQLIFSVPYAGSETPNRLMMVDIDSQGSPWTMIDMQCYSFGQYENTVNYDWDTLPFNEWASWNWESWKSSESSAGAITDTCTDSSGFVFKMNDSRLDDGTEYESVIVFDTSLSNNSSLPFYKRLLKMQAYMRDSAGGTVDVSVKRDMETEWVSAGALTLGGGRDINTIVLPVDFRAKSFKIKLTSKHDFQLVGMILWFQPLGDR